MDTDSLGDSAFWAVLSKLESAPSDDVTDVPLEAIVRAMSVLVSAFSRRSLDADERLQIIDVDRVTPTEAATAAYALLEAFDLSPFDLAMWQSRMDSAKTRYKR